MPTSARKADRRAHGTPHDISHYRTAPLPRSSHWPGRSVGAVSAEGWIGGWRSFAWKVWGVRAKVTRLEEVHLPGAGYSLGAAARPQLAVEVVDVGLDGADGDEELACDLPVGLAGGDEREHLQLPLAQGLGEPPVGSRRRGLLREGRQELREVARRDLACRARMAALAGFERRRQEVSHRSSLVDGGSDVALRFSHFEGLREGAHGLLFLV